MRGLKAGFPTSGCIRLGKLFNLLVAQFSLTILQTFAIFHVLAHFIFTIISMTYHYCFHLRLKN